MQKPTPGILKHEWARSMLADAPIVPFPNLPPPWSDVPLTYHDKLGAAKASQRKHLQQIKTQQMDAWSKSWESYQTRVIEPSIAQTAPLDNKRLEIHSLLKKAESVLFPTIPPVYPKLRLPRFPSTSSARKTCTSSATYRDEKTRTTTRTL